MPARASFVASFFGFVGVAGVVACVMGTTSPAEASAPTEETLSLESSAAGESGSQIAVCGTDKHRCGTGAQFACCEPGDQCCRHKGGHVYCAKKKCSAHQPKN